MLDARLDLWTEFDDYRNIDSIPTPFVERRRSAADLAEVDTWVLAEYNRRLPEGLFDARPELGARSDCC